MNENKKLRKFLEGEGYDVDGILGKKPNKTLTGKELRIAAAKKLKIRYIETYYNPQDRHMNSNTDCVMEECGNNTKDEHTYYVDNSTITLEEFADDAEVKGDFPEGTFEVRRVKGVKYI